MLLKKKPVAYGDRGEGVVFVLRSRGRGMTRPRPNGYMKPAGEPEII